MTSPFTCAGCRQALQWASICKLCDVDAILYCGLCVENDRACNHPLSNVNFALPSERSRGSASITCNACQQNYPSNGWIGDTCYLHDYDICKQCITRPGYKSKDLYNHRVQAHARTGSVDWVFHVNKKQQGIDPTPRGRADPSAPNFSGTANSQHWFNVGFYRATGKGPVYDV